MSDPISEQSGSLCPSGQNRPAVPTPVGQRPGDGQPRRANPRTLDGYQIPFARPTPSPPKSKYTLKSVKTSTSPLGNRIPAGAFSQHTSARIPSKQITSTPRAMKTGSAAVPSGSGSHHGTPHSHLVPQKTNFYSPSTASRVRFVSQKSASRSQHRASYPMGSITPSAAHRPAQFPAPIAQRRHSINPSLTLTTPTKKTDAVVVKTTTAIKPLWQQLDDEREEELLRRNKRDRSGNVLSFVKRINSTAHRRQPTATAASADLKDPNLPTAQIAPKLRLQIGDVKMDDSDSNDDEPRYRPKVRQIGRKSQTFKPQSAAKKSAARKVEWVDATPSESESSDDETRSMASLSDKSKDDQPSEVDELLSKSPTEDIDMEENTPELENAPNLEMPEIILLDNPRYDSVAPLQLDATAESEPLEDLLAAVEALTLPVVRMQKTSRLPFLLRNVRYGFLKRCRNLQVPIFTDGRSVSLLVRYEYIAGTMYQTKIESWRCPLCDLLGAVNTQEMLHCHMRWDHPEVYCEWHKLRETEEQEFWELRLLIPEVPKLKEDVRRQMEETDLQPLSSPAVQQKYDSMVFETRSATPLPSISVSPSAAHHSTEPFENSAEDVKPSAFELEVRPRDAHPPEFLTPSIRSTTNDLSSRERSTTTGTISTLTPALRTTQRRPSASIDPAPPPSENPLGPAAQPPYLPAESDYGGPTVYYSCRPGGPCLFDLLGTLPMEPYGLLDWEIIDREEEIYESDDVKEEYKIMHALWARWIMLNRNKFISNYHRGVISFIDQYWKFIHKAAGWDALRYWLFILLGNEFLTGREVAKTLLHYEGLTGMAHWYDS